MKVVRSTGEYKRAVEADSFQKMVNLRPLLPSAAFELRYAGTNNFTGQTLYKKCRTTFLRLKAARALQAAAAELLQNGYTLKIWDAYRPYSVTQKMWDLIGDERYVANPTKGSGHNRGLAVDLTLLKDGHEVDMGTGFDNFTDTAHHAFTNLPEAVLSNRRLLRTAMEKQGFKALDTEWWHYSFPNDRNYEVLDVPFQKLTY